MPVSGKRKRRAVKSRRGTPVPNAHGEDLNAASRALLGREDQPRRMRPEPRDDASVEDPLRDWPED
jgi:hypothetical protein